MDRETPSRSRRNTLKMIGAAAAGIPALSGPATAAYSESDFSSDLNSIMDEYDINGVSVAILAPEMSHTDRFVEAFGYNYRQVRPRGYNYYDPLTTDHRLRIASITKTITSSAILSLIERGDIRDKDKAVFQGYPALWKSEYGDPDTDCPLTVGDLLNHNYKIDTIGYLTPPSGPPYDYDLRETIQHIHENHEIERFKTSIAWGDEEHEWCSTGYEYNNYGYGALGILVEEAVDGSFNGGDTYESYVRENVLPPGSKGMDAAETEYGAVENEGYHYSDYSDPYDEDNVADKAWSIGSWAGTAEEVANFGGEMNARFGDEYDLTDCGWGDVSLGNTDYVGHTGAQLGIRSALWVSDDHSFCILMNTRNDWDDDENPRAEITQIANDLAEEKF